MSSLLRCSKLLTLAAVLGVVSTAGCTPQETASVGEASAMSSMQEGSLVHDGQELFGHYHQPEPFPQSLPDDAHSHDGWTWGSMGAVFAESPDKIWIAMRGELPLPGKPWTDVPSRVCQSTVSGGYREREGGRLDVGVPLYGRGTQLAADGVQSGIKTRLSSGARASKFVRKRSGFRFSAR